MLFSKVNKEINVNKAMPPPILSAVAVEISSPRKQRGEREGEKREKRKRVTVW
jgi:hypothetical protein